MGTSTNNLLQSIHTITVQIGTARHVDEVYDAALDGLALGVVQMAIHHLQGRGVQERHEAGAAQDAP